MGKKTIKTMPRARTFTLHPRSRTVTDTRAECSRRSMMTYAVYVRKTDPKQADELLNWIEKEILHQRKLAGLKPITDIEAIRILREKYGDGKKTLIPVEGGVKGVKEMVDDFDKKKKEEEE